MKPSPSALVWHPWHLCLMVNERERKDGLEDIDVDTTQLGPALNFTAPEILQRMSVVTCHTVKPRSSH